MATSSHSPLIPKLNNVSDDYEIKEVVLGIGMSGKIRLCVHRKTQKQYALKVIYY
jgi:hypothetical protein